MDLKDDFLKFMEWTAYKARLHASSKTQYPKKKQVWWVALGHNIGVETNGKHASFERPALVLREFNADSYLIVPLSSNEGSHPYQIPFIDGSGIARTANIFQLRTVSAKRFLRKYFDIDEAVFNTIIDAIRDNIFIKTEAPE